MKNLRKIFAMALAIIMMMGLSTVAFAAEPQTPVVTVQLVHGSTTSAFGSVTTGEGTLNRTVSATTGDVETTVQQIAGAITGIQSALKFDRNDTADQKIQKANRELYTDTGHFTDPSTVTVTDAPEGYPWKYVGNGDYSGHYVSHVKVVYERDEAGNALKDENGNYIIKELQHAGTGTPLYYNGELVTNPEGPFHFATGTRPQQFLLMNEKGETIYGYCIDLDTGAESGKWYAMANLEDNDYYASEEAENHVRNIVLNGYWGTESGTGSLASLKEALKANKDMFDVEQDVTLVNRQKFDKYPADYVLQEGEYHHGSYVYWSLPTEHVVLTDEIIDQLTEGEALDAMQAAIWSWANGSNGNLNGVDRAIVGDLYAASSQMSDSLNGENDYEGAARTKALYQYLMGQNDSQEPTVIINDKTFAKDMSLKIGEEVTDGVYAAELNFTVDGERNANDDLKVVLTYTDINGAEAALEISLTGEDAAVADESGYYTIPGMQLKAGEAFRYNLQIIGEQYLERGAYIFTAEGGTDASQTMVTMAEGTMQVNVSRTTEITFGVEETFHKADPVPETTEVYVAKQWVGDTAETRPASVDVQLLRNGIVYDTVTLTANNGWAARWFGLDIDATWTVAEASIPAGYTASVAQNGNSFVITNTFGVELPEHPVPMQPSAPSMGDFFIDEEDVPLADVPATGDPLTVMAAMSVLSVAGVYFTGKKRDEE